jgi:S1-C subfamily serine protease
VRVTVRDESGRIDPGGWAEAADCPSLRPLGSSADGELLYEASPGRCVLRAVRQDGLVRVEGDLGSVTVAPGEDAQVTLTLPSSSRGGVQLAFQPDREGARIRWLPEGSELALAGIRDGDVLVSADGRPLAGLEAAEVSAALTGPEGDEVQLEVLRRGDTGDLLETVVLRHARVE